MPNTNDTPTPAVGVPVLPSGPPPGVPALPTKYPLHEASLAVLNERFEYHAPKGDQAQRYALLRAKARELAIAIIGNTPASREQSLALTHLDEVVMFANASIARNEQPVRCPAGDECNANAQVEIRPGVVGFACWYPQMGGYSGKAVVVSCRNANDDRGDHEPCFDVYVWHDGEFPFAETRSPAVLHHCSARQFIEFGQLVLARFGLVN